MNDARRIIFIIVALGAGVLGVVVIGVVVLVLGIFKLVDATDAHRCALAYVQRSPDALALLGSPIVQKGFTGGSSNSTGEKLNEDLTFHVTGPKGEASVESEGRRSPALSHLEVTLEQNDRRIAIYSGVFDCPELHAAAK